MNSIKKKLDLSGLLLIFIGMLFTIFYINIGGFDIIPDFIGCILIIVGIFKLKPVSPYFKSAVSTSIILLVLSVVNLFSAQLDNVLIEVPNYLSKASDIIASGVYLAVELVLYYTIFKGVNHIIEKYNPNYSLKSTGQKLFFIYYAISVVQLVCVELFNAFNLDFIALVLSILAIVSLVCLAIIVAYIFNIYRTFNNIEYNSSIDEVEVDSKDLVQCSAVSLIILAGYIVLGLILAIF